MKFRPAYFPVHLATCVTITVMAGAMMLLNTREQTDSDIERFGWPMPVELRYERREAEDRASPFVGRVKWFEPRMLGNEAVWILLIGVSAFACERSTRKRVA